MYTPAKMPPSSSFEKNLAGDFEQVVKRSAQFTQGKLVETRGRKFNGDWNQARDTVTSTRGMIGGGSGFTVSMVVHPDANLPKRAVDTLFSFRHTDTNNDNNVTCEIIAAAYGNNGKNPELFLRTYKSPWNVPGKDGPAGGWSDIKSKIIDWTKENHIVYVAQCESGCSGDQPRGTAKLFVNGKQLEARGNHHLLPAKKTRKLYFGHSGISNNRKYYGTMRDCHVWDVALPDGIVQAIYRNGGSVKGIRVAPPGTLIVSKYTHTIGEWDRSDVELVTDQQLVDAFASVPRFRDTGVVVDARSASLFKSVFMGQHVLHSNNAPPPAKYNGALFEATAFLVILAHGYDGDLSKTKERLIFWAIVNAHNDVQSADDVEATMQRLLTAVDGMGMDSAPLRSVGTTMQAERASLLQFVGDGAAWPSASGKVSAADFAVTVARCGVWVVGTKQARHLIKQKPELKFTTPFTAGLFSEKNAEPWEKSLDGLPLRPLVCTVWLLSFASTLAGASAIEDAGRGPGDKTGYTTGQAEIVARFTGVPGTSNNDTLNKLAERMEHMKAGSAGDGARKVEKAGNGAGRAVEKTEGPVVEKAEGPAVDVSKLDSSEKIRITPKKEDVEAVKKDVQEVVKKTLPESPETGSDDSPMVWIAIGGGVLLIVAVALWLVLKIINAKVIDAKGGGDSAK